MSWDRNERFSAARALTLSSVSIVPPPQPLHTDGTIPIATLPPLPEHEFVYFFSTKKKDTKSRRRP